MSSDRAALLEAIKAAPDDDAPRLVYADFLDEHGEAERARFVRHQISFRYNGELVGHTADTLTEAERGPLPPLPLGEFIFYRGFVEKVRVSAADWLSHADALLAEHPVREVHLTTWPELESRPAENHGIPNTREYFLPVRPVYILVTSFPPDLYRSQEYGIAEMLRRAWPGVRFRLPEQHEIGERLYVNGEYRGRIASHVIGYADGHRRHRLQLENGSDYILIEGQGDWQIDATGIVIGQAGGGLAVTATFDPPA